jgi:Flp pilus assembly protein TadG
MSKMKPRNDVAKRGRRAFGADERGLAAIEFAFVLPLMLLIYLGLVELARGMRASQKVDLVAHVLGDLAGQTLSGGTNAGQAGLANADFTNIFSAAAILLAPLPTTSLKITISEVNIWSPSTGTYKANVNWTHSYQSGTLRNTQGCGPSQLNSPLTAKDVAPISPNSMPTAYTNAANTPALGPVIVVDVSYGYALTFNIIPGAWQSNGVLTMQRTSYSPVRNQYSTPAVSGQATLYPLYNHIQDLTTSATAGTNCLAGWGGTQ